MKSYRPLLLSLVVATCSACGTGPTVDPAPNADEVSQQIQFARSTLQRDRHPVVADGALEKAVADNNRFAADLYQQIAKSRTDQNLFFSAYSMSWAFAMLRDGARGATATNIASALRFTLPGEQLDPAMNELGLELESRAGDGKGTDGNGFRLSVKSALWGETTTTFEPAYLDAVAASYDAGVQLIDFAHSTESARKTINAWAASATENRIQNLLPRGALDSSTRFVLTNTVYFNAAWAEPFVSTDMTFPQGSGSRVPAFAHEGGMKYAATDTATVIVAIPYEGRKLEMVVVLPNDLATFESTLAGDALQALLDQPVPELVRLTMPKFGIDGDTFAVNDELAALGLNTKSADLTGISPDLHEPLAVLHKAFVKVNEKGTEAAAATVFGPAGASPDAPPPPQPKIVTVDRPFLFFVRDVPTKQVLFSGRVVTPSYQD